MGQIRKTAAQIQNELDEMHHLLSQGATDEYIMKTRKLERRHYYRLKKRLYAQVAKIYQEKREQDYYYDVLLCKERLTQDRVNALSKSNETKSPIWGMLASELAVSILKLEAEGIQSIKNGRYKLIAQEAGHYRPMEPATALPVLPTGESESNATRSEPSPDDPTF